MARVELVVAAVGQPLVEVAAVRGRDVRVVVTLEDQDWRFDQICPSSSPSTGSSVS
jgi:hypothetical protein